MGDVHVRPAGISDAAFLADCNCRIALETEHLTLIPATILAGVSAALADPAKALYFIAEIAGERAGCLMITHEWSDWRNGDVWWIQSVYVRPEHRRQGAFRTLYEHVRHAAREAGAVGLRLYVEGNNAAAQATYARMGMARTHYHVMEEFWAAWVQ